jgi:hypothetical protein
MRKGRVKRAVQLRRCCRGKEALAHNQEREEREESSPVHPGIAVRGEDVVGPARIVTDRLRSPPDKCEGTNIKLVSGN